jgi:hypothetical protein
MPDKKAYQLRQEIASERERLGGAVDDLRAEVDELKRKLPYVAAAAVATLVLVRVVRRRLSD